MGQNIEIKARLDAVAAVEARVAKLATDGPDTLRQRDTFFRVARGRLKLREIEGQGAELIAYQRPDRSGPALSRYTIVPISDARACLEALGTALGELCCVEKVRTLYRVGTTRVHLDRVRELGEFIELEVVLEPEQSTEAGRAIAEALLAALEVPESARVAVAYADLLTAI